MTVKEMREWLKQFPEDTEVFVLEEKYNGGYNGYSANWEEFNPLKYGVQINGNFEFFERKNDKKPELWLGEN